MIMIIMSFSRRLARAPVAGIVPFMCWGQAHMLRELIAKDAGQSAHRPSVCVCVCVCIADCASMTGSVTCWGQNWFGQLGLGHDGLNTARRAVDLGPGAKAVAIAAGNRHTCALLNATRAVKCWGRNNFGELGLGNDRSRGAGPDDMGTNLPTVGLGPGARAVAMAAGGTVIYMASTPRYGDHTCAVLNGTGAVKCWGANSYGQLGLGNITYRGDGLNQMGANLPAVDLGLGAQAMAIAA
jgi:alpha-tubulin suppressor-like RCC1 family protein